MLMRGKWMSGQGHGRPAREITRKMRVPQKARTFAYGFAA
jgi:hypothetical protein